MLTDWRGSAEGYDPSGTVTQLPPLQLGAEAQYTISPPVVTPINSVTLPVREMATWFRVRPPLSGMVVKVGDAPTAFVNWMALPGVARATMLAPLLATWSAVTPLTRVNPQPGDGVQMYTRPLSDMTTFVPSDE
jgi:hypothetical protein